MSGFASRLYRGEAGLKIIPRRKRWFTIAGALALFAVVSFVLQGFHLGIEFRGGNEFQIPVSVGTMDRAETAVADAAGDLSSDEPVRVVSAQQVGENTYLIRTTEIDQRGATAVQAAVADDLGIAADEISSNRVSGAWGAQVTERALLGLVIFLALVTVYLVLRFEARMAIAAVVSLLFNLLFTAGVYSAIGFEVTPSTIIGFLTILGFALYDVVVVFDKIQENTRGITAGTTQTYAEASNLAINQTLMRSINTSVVALLPVGGLLFIGAGLLGAGTLKDLGLVLFVGMAVAFFTSIFVATPLLVTLKEQEPRLKSHTQRVLARRAGAATGTTRRTPSARRTAAATGDAATDEPVEQTDDEPVRAQSAALAGSTPKVGARPAKRSGGGQRSGGRGGRSGGNRPGGKRR
nr:protein translocase subunit SecF [Micromonospora sp. DSM 115978]